MAIMEALTTERQPRNVLRAPTSSWPWSAVEHRVTVLQVDPDFKRVRSVLGDRPDAQRLRSPGDRPA